MPCALVTCGLCLMKSSSRLWFVLTASLALVCVAWLLQRDSTDTIAEHPADPTSTTTESALEPPASESNVSSEPRVAITDSANTAATSDSSAAKPRASDAAWRILVVDAATNEPVAGADVRWARVLSMTTLNDPHHPYRIPAVEDLVPADGPHVVTDASGAARLPSGALPGVVVAKKGEATGGLTIRDRVDGDLVLRIGFAPGITIQVVDANGHGVAGVPVGIRATDAPAANSFAAWLGVTSGPDGFAQVRDVSRQLKMLGPNPECVVYLPILTKAPVSITLDLAHLPTEPVRMILPACGSVVARVHDSAGKPVLASKVSLSEFSAAVTSENDARRSQAPDDDARDIVSFDPTEILEGQAVYPFVGLDLQLSLVVTDGTRRARVTGAGPRGVGEVVTFDVDMGAPLSTLRGRLVDERGLPIGDCDLWFAFDLDRDGARGPTRVQSVRSAHFGQFETNVPYDDSTGMRGVVRIRGNEMSDHADRMTLLPISNAIRPGVNDLGDIVLHAPSSIASGRVVDEAGQPIPQVVVSVSVRTNSEVNLTGWITSFAPRSTRTDEQGLFDLRGILEEPKASLYGDRPGWLRTGPVEVPVGSRDVILRMSRAGEIAGKVLLDDPKRAPDVRIVLRHAGDTDEQRQATMYTESAGLRSDGTFRVSRARPLVFDATVMMNGRSEPLLVIENVDLRGGGPSKDPRLATIDVRGRIEAPTNPGNR